MAMTREEHIKRHQELHNALDELVADWITHTSQLPTKASVYSLIQWSHEQTLHPTPSPEPLNHA